MKNHPLSTRKSPDFLFQGEMVKKTVVKTKFSQLNDKRFYFPVGIVSLPFGHKNLKEIDEFKQEKGKKIEKKKKKKKMISNSKTEHY